MDQLEAMPSLKGSDVQGLERFADLVRITVVKLQAEGRDGELGEGTLHGLLVKKLAERPVESYIVVSLGNITRRGRSRTLFAGRGGVGGKDVKPPCAVCEGNHGIWSCQRFQDMKVQDRWNIAKVKHLCFRCLESDRQGKACLSQSKACKTDGCTKNLHALLYDSAPPVKRPEDKNPVVLWEGTLTTNNSDMVESEQSKGVKVNALLDDASNETFFNLTLKFQECWTFKNHCKQSKYAC
ncbi:Hypothetical predicted protein [Paramuricea clavata]|uniref:Uncharacterized protein n=1 Tax=Paramuricea clavata TaxID=317549 RepID=A0A6S7GSB1_PARCT|nr:Hypothetical predicted protein [Paramuricea clavata]